MIIGNETHGQIYAYLADKALEYSCPNNRFISVYGTITSIRPERMKDGQQLREFQILSVHNDAMTLRYLRTLAESFHRKLVDEMGFSYGEIDIAITYGLPCLLAHTDFWHLAKESSEQAIVAPVISVTFDTCTDPNSDRFYEKFDEAVGDIIHHAGIAVGIFAAE